MSWRPEVTKGGVKALGYWATALVLVWVLDFFIAGILNAYYFSILMYAGINVVLAVSLNLVNGFTGQFSMGHAGFMAVGAYVSAFLTTWVRDSAGHLLTVEPVSSLIFIGSLVAGGISAGMAGYLVGLPSLRLKGDYLAIATLGFGEIIRVLLLNMSAVGGARGLPGIPLLSTFGWVYTFVVLSTFTVWRVVNSPQGRSFLSVREDEIAAEAMSVDTTKAKVRAFVIGAVFAGIAGGMFAHFLQFLTPAIFDFNRSFEVIIMVVLGGMGSLTGSVLAAIFLTAIREALRPLQELTKIDFRMIIYSLLLIVLMLTRPNGIFGTKEFTAYLSKKFRKRFSLRAEAD